MGISSRPKRPAFYSFFQSWLWVWAVIFSVAPAAWATEHDDTEATPVWRSDKEIIKEAPASVVVGEEFTYTLQVKNERTTAGGPFLITGVQIVDVLPSQVAFVSATIDRGGCSHNAGQVTCSIPSVDRFETITISIVVRALEVGTARNTATITAIEFDPDSANNSDTVETVIRTPEADVFVLKAASQDTVVVGDTLQFVLTVGNNGPDAASGVQLTDAVPTGVSVAGVVTTKGACTATGNDVGCSIGDVGVGETVTVTISAVGQTPGMVSNVAQVMSETSDPNSENNQNGDDVLVVRLPEADVFVLKAASRDTVVVGDTLQFVLTVGNNGPDAASGVQLTDVVPAGVTVTGVATTKGDCSATGNDVGCAIGDVGVGETITVTVTAVGQAPGVVSNVAQVMSETSDPNSENNQNGDDVLVVRLPEADVFVLKAASRDTVVVGDTLQFVLTVGNNGPDAASGVQLSDVVPAGVSVAGVSTSKGDCTATGNDVGCAIGDVGVGETITVTVTAVGQMPGVVSNVARVTSETRDPNGENNQNGDEVLVGMQFTDLVVRKTASADSIQSGEIPTYTVTVTNTGPASAENVVVRDTLAFGSFSPESFSSTKGDCAQEVRASEGYYLITCTVGSMAPGETVTLTIRAITTVGMANADSATVRNKAVATTTSAETNIENNDSFVDVFVERAQNVDIAVTKTASADTVSAGGAITYMLTVTNVGDRTASSVQLLDLLPPDAQDVQVTGVPCSIATTDLVRITCNVGSLAPGASVTVTVTAKAPGSLFGRNFTNTALVSSTDPNELDTNFENDRAEVTVYVEPPEGDIGITKTAEPDSAKAGEAVTYRIIVINNGPNEVVDIVMNDPVDTSALDSVTVSSVRGRCSQTAAGVITQVQCAISSLGEGETAEITIRAVAKRLLQQKNVRNEATVSAPAPDTNPENNTAAAEVLIRPAPPRTASNAEQSGYSGDPVNMFTGEFVWWEDETIFHMGGPLPLLFYRYYASGIAADGRIEGAFGPNWLHPYETVLRQTEGHIQIVTNTGRELLFDADGSGWALSGQQDIPYQLAERSTTFTLADPVLNRVWIYDRDGKLVEIADGKGNALQLTYNGDQLFSVEDGLGRALAFTYDSDGRLTAAGNGLRQAAFGYTNGLLTSYTNPRGFTTTYTYDTAHPQPGLLTSYTLPNGNTPITQVYDAEGRVASQTDAVGNTYQFAYEGDQVISTDPLGNTQGYVHDQDGHLMAWRDEAGNSIRYDYDMFGRRSAITDRLGAVARMAYHEPSGKIAELQYADGTQFTITYTEREVEGVLLYEVATVVSPDGAIDRFEYDSNGNLVNWIDRGGFQWPYVHNNRGQIIEARNPEGGAVSYQYYGNGMLASLTDDRGNTTTYEYDIHSNVIRTTHPDGTGRTYVYDASDRIVGVTMERGDPLAYTYDANGNLESITNALGHATRFAYDGLDRLTTITDAEGGQTLRSYDPLSRLAQFTGANGGTITYGYDALGRKTSITDAAGQTTTHTYDAEGVLRSSTNPLGHTTQYITDVMGRVTEVVSPTAERFGFVFDAMGRTILQNDPAGNTSTATYDTRGWPTSFGLPNGLATASYARNSVGARTQLTDPLSQAWQTQYDPLGRVEAMRDPLGQEARITYDSRNQIENITLPSGLGTLNVGYDAAGQVVKRTFSDGTDLRYTYDEAFRMTEANGINFAYDAEGRITETNGITMQRDTGGRLVAQTLAPGKTVQYTYNSRDQVETITDWLGGKTEFAYDAAGRLIRLTRPNGIVSAFTFDANNRLVTLEETTDPQAAEGRRSRLDFSYDRQGNLVEAIRDVPLAPTLEEASQQQGYDAASQVAQFTYDALGRLVRDSVRTYTWDLASRLTRYEDPKATVDLTYDAGGHVLTRTVDNATRSFVWNYATALPTLSVERADTGDEQYYIYGPEGGLLYRVEAATEERRFYHFDERGNTLFTSDDGGALVSRFAYSPYGEVLGAADAVDERFTFMGAYGVMQEGDLYYAHMRYYDPAAGRFLSRDPLTTPHPLDASPYQYAYANPIRYWDPSGLKPGDPQGEGCTTCEDPGCSCREAMGSFVPATVRDNPIQVYEATKPKAAGVVLQGAVLIVYDGSEAQFPKETTRYISELKALGIDVYTVEQGAITVALGNSRLRRTSLSALGLTPERLRSISGILTIGHGNKSATGALGATALTTLMSEVGSLQFLAMLSCESYDFYEKYQTRFDTYLSEEAAVFGFHGPAPLGVTSNGFGPTMPVVLDGNYSITFETDPLLQFIIGGAEASRYRSVSYQAHATANTLWAFKYSYEWWKSYFTGERFRPEGGVKGGNCNSGRCR